MSLVILQVGAARACWAGRAVAGERRRNAVMALIKADETIVSQGSIKGLKTWEYRCGKEATAGLCNGTRLGLRAETLRKERDHYEA